MKWEEVENVETKLVAKTKNNFSRCCGVFLFGAGIKGEEE
jgi:hypothetical protein